MMNKTITRFALAGLAMTMLASCSKKQEQPAEEQPEETAYVFSYFDTKTEAAGLKLAYSYDGYHWTALNDNKSILSPTVGDDKLMRDPSICMAPDGTFHMVWTSSWHDQIIGYASSPDLINWSEQQAIPVMKQEPKAQNCWAPELFYDDTTKTYWIYWATTIPDAPGIKTEGCLSESDQNHRIYCTTTKDFKTFTPTRLFFNPDFNAIDAAIVRDPETKELIMAVKNEGLNPVAKDIHIHRAKSMEEGFDTIQTPAISPKWTEGPSPLFIGNDLIVFYDCYSKHTYGASLSHDHGQTWEDATDSIQMPVGMSHGTAIAVPKSVVEKLLEAFPNTTEETQPEAK